MQINFKRGFNRLFLLVAFAWAVYALWYVPVHELHERQQMAIESWTACLSAASGEITKTEACNAEQDKKLRELPRTAWSDLDWKGWLFFVGLALIPPVAAYWLLRAAAAIIRWIWRGFLPS